MFSPIKKLAMLYAAQVFYRTGGQKFQDVHHEDSLTFTLIMSAGFKIAAHLLVPTFMLKYC